MPAEEIRKTIQQISQLTHNPFAANLFIFEKHYASNEQIEQAKKIVQASCRELNFEISSILTASCLSSSVYFLTVLVISNTSLVDA